MKNYGLIQQSSVLSVHSVAMYIYHQHLGYISVCGLLLKRP
jgi:hypothetical protein